MNNRDVLLKKMVEGLELPESAYEKARNRYEDIGDWIGREDSSCNNHDPHIFPQGSFRLGTAIRPLNNNEEYDLDLACNLRAGITASSHSQKELKDLIGAELESYRKSRGIQSPLDEKRRCWRLDYADSLSFHMDIVPCIPEDEANRHVLTAMMENRGLDRKFASEVGELAVGITDNSLPNYKQRNTPWQISNPEGYARWFEEKMRISQLADTVFAEAKVDELPIYKRKTSLQRAIQFLKRHRDQMFSDKPDSKPISVIITTIAGNSYSGTSNLHEAVAEIISGLRAFAKSREEVLPNPVNPDENFADKWSMPEYRNYRLKENYNLWTVAVERDFNQLTQSDNAKALSDSIKDRFVVNISEQSIASDIGVSSKTSSPAAPHIIQSEPNKPWLEK